MSSQNLNSLELFFKKIFHIIVHKSGKYFLFVFICAGAGFYYYTNQQKQVSETTFVALGELKQYVEVTGSVQASRDANLSFQTIGAVNYLAVKIGNVVPQGKILASLQSSDAEAGYLQAKAQLASAEATLGQVTQGFRKEEIAIKQQIADNAKNAIEQSYLSLPDTIRNVDSTTADIIKNKLSSLFVNNGDRYKLSFTSCDQSLQSEIETSRSSIENTLADYQRKSSVISVISSQENIDSVFELAYSSTVATNNLITLTSNLLLSSCSLQNPSLDNARVALSGVKITMNSLFLDITTKRNALNLSKNTLSQALRDLDLVKAGTDPYKIKAQAAIVNQAEAQVAQALSSLNKTKIIAPFAGTISDVFITEGENVSPGKTVISMLAVDAFEIEAKVPEVDIVKIKNGANVEVTLDAYGKSVVFPATLTRINPTATTEGGVPLYKVIVTFTGKDVRIKSGMTANVSIITENKPQALVLPARFVQVTDVAHGSVIVHKKEGDMKKEIRIGVRGKDGSLEVLSGLVVGDEVVSPSTAVRSAQKQTK